MEKVAKYRLVDGKRIDTGEPYIRNSEWLKGDENCYIVGINNWIVNSKGKFLLQRRSMKKKNNPGKWCSTNGLIQFGENNIETVKRETLEELGIKLEDSQIFLLEENHYIDKHWLVDIFITYVDINLEDIKIQESEVDKVDYFSLEDLLKLDLSTTCSYIEKLATKIYEALEVNFGNVRK